MRRSAHARQSFMRSALADHPVPPRSTLEALWGCYDRNGNGLLSLAEIDEVVAGFASAAVRAREAGFDGVEIHGANGYLLDQFFTEYTNQRDDHHGGSRGTRPRLRAETLHAARRAGGARGARGRCCLGGG